MNKIVPINPSGIHSLLAFHAWLFVLIALAYYGFSYGVLPLQVFPLLLILGSLTYAAGAYTGRRILSVAVLLSAFLGIVLGYASESSGWLLAYPFAAISSSNYLVLALAVLFPYLVLVWFRSHPEHYSNAARTRLNPKEMEELAAIHRVKRQRFRRAAAAVVAVIVAINVASLFTDPPADISYLFPPDHTVARDQNAYYLLESAAISPDIMTAGNGPSTVSPATAKLLAGNVGGTEWDRAEAAKLLAENDGAIKKFQASALLFGYQIPGLEQVATRQPVQNFNMPQLQNYTVLSQLNLLAATYAGDPQQQADLALLSLKVGQRIAASNQTYIGGIVAAKLEATAVQYLAARSFPASVREQILLALPSEHEIWNNARNSVRTEATVLLSVLPGIYSQVGDPALTQPYPPFWYQPNRTAALIAANYQKVISLPDGDCGTATPPDYSAFPNPFSLLGFNGIGKQFARFSDVSFNYKYQCALEKNIGQLRGRPAA